MSIKILPLEERDISTAVRVELEAFRNHPRTPMMWPRGYTDDLYAYAEGSKLKAFREDSESRSLKAVDSETGQIAAIADWSFMLDPDADAAKPGPDPNAQPGSDWPEGGNWGMRMFYKVEWDKWRREVLGGKPYILLDILTVDPKFQGLGAGSQLLAWGTEQADEKGLAMCLESTPAGLSLYKRYGFEERRTINANMKDFGYMEPYDEQASIRIWMTREPRLRN